MSFISLQYLFFLPTITLIYFLLPYGMPRIAALLMASCIFYMAYIPKYILILFLLIVVDYGAAFLIDATRGPARRAWLIVSLSANLGILGFFKYYGFILGSLASLAGWLGHPFSFPPLGLLFPLGLSFHTFQSMSYTIDVYRGQKTVERNLVKYALYVLFFPQLVAGPIERAGHLLPQFSAPQKFDVGRLGTGLRLILVGLVKKAVLADRLAPFVENVFGHPLGKPGWAIFIGVWFGTLQFYGDTAGYTDIARGSAQILGFELVQNFRRPFAANDAAEYWRRYHMSLISWLRDYLYIPLGGSKNSAWHRLATLLVTFTLAGLWHGPNWTFVVWGLLQGILVTVSHIWARGRRKSARDGRLSPGGVLAAIVLINSVVVSNIFFRARSLDDACYMVSHLFSNLGAPLDPGVYGYTWFDFTLALSFIPIVIVAHRIGDAINVSELYEKSSPWVRWGLVYTGLGLLVALGKFAGQTFIYFQF